MRALGPRLQRLVVYALDRQPNSSYSLLPAILKHCTLLSHLDLPPGYTQGVMFLNQAMN